MTKDEVCELLHCAPRTLDRWRSLWRAKKVDVGEVRVGRRTLFNRQRLEAALAAPGRKLAVV